MAGFLRNSSFFIAYMGGLGWGSAYFYGWGGAFYYGFPWWFVGAGVDDVSRSLFFAVTVIGIFLAGWGTGFLFFFAVKRKNPIQDLSILRLYLAVLLLFLPVIIEFSVLKHEFQTSLLIFSSATALGITVAIRTYGHILSVSCLLQKPFVRKNLFEIIMIFFITYFWFFSFMTGYYKPQFKKQYEMINYNNNWYYVLARYDNRLILSKSFNAGSQRFIVFQTEQNDSLQIDVVRSRI